MTKRLQLAIALLATHIFILGASAEVEDPDPEPAG